MQFRSDKVLDATELHGMCVALGFRPSRVKFDHADVPANLREFVHYAEIWGENCHDRRSELVQATPRWLRKHVPEVVFVPDVQDRFDDWLAGPEVDREPLTAAYLAFTCLRIAADEMDR